MEVCATVLSCLDLKLQRERIIISLNQPNTSRIRRGKTNNLILRNKIIYSCLKNFLPTPLKSNIPPQNIPINIISQTSPNIVRLESIPSQVSHTTLYSINVFIARDFSLVEIIFSASAFPLHQEREMWEGDLRLIP